MKMLILLIQINLEFFFLFKKSLVSQFHFFLIQFHLILLYQMNQ